MAHVKDLEKPKSTIPPAPPSKPNISTGFLPILSDTVAHRIAVAVCERKKADAETGQPRLRLTAFEKFSKYL